MPTRQTSQRSPDSPAPASGEAADADTPKRVLLADDDRLIVATVGQTLRAGGYEVLEAFDGPTALAICKTQHPDLAILDHSMPGMSGVELARALASSTGVPVIFLSAYSDEEIVNDAIVAGAMTYIVKPIDTDRLVPIVRTALQRAREFKALRLQNDKLRAALQKDHNVSVAAGVLMAKFNLGQHEAFERLRRHARSLRAKLEDVATELLRVNDEAGKILQEFAATPSTPAATAPEKKV
ncbi:MAG TPA: response regulator [Steroidobacteraceae bacterium]|nr:response regulator [Steroidobacteraceae bacterium]